MSTKERWQNKKTKQVYAATWTFNDWGVELTNLATGRRHDVTYETLQKRYIQLADASK